MNHCVDAEVRGTLKLKRKQSIYRKLGFIYTKEVLWLLFAALFAKLFAKLFAETPRALKALRLLGTQACALSKGDASRPSVKVL